MFHRILLFAATVAIFSLSSAHSAPAPITPADVQARMPEVRDMMKSEVFYYPATMFREVRAGTEAGDPSGMFFLCGWVNESKVTYEVGWRTFYIRVWPTGGTGLPPTFSMSQGTSVAHCPITDVIPGDFTKDVSAQPVARP